MIPLLFLSLISTEYIPQHILTEQTLNTYFLRSPQTTEIKTGDIFSNMEVTSVDSGRIELRNMVPIEFAPDRVINLMGNLNIKVESSNTTLSFYPYRVKDPNDT